ncbi:winged helix-turn-helix domain-containing protein [Bremerella cremea]|uniref:Winged helix-turn-helix domain-containing protein n=1 Tax=Bremerella cremea TaxID=1031537 RepID=A0A368KRU9_9BACT|nr:winged helix-turn-helix domain-containing protein [Bremerella cremea]RCS50452.1 winged helix-turn-helix domain-containing protein [Bremerella cremea]
MRPHGSAAELEARRLKALDLIRQGWRVKYVGVTSTTASTWKNKPQHVPQCRLDARQKQQLAAGFPTDLWTRRRVAQVVHEKFGIEYNPDHLCRILHDLGFSCQKPERQAREQDVAAIETWRAEDWPRIKKGAKQRS